MTTITEINWNKDETTGDLVAGAYRIHRKTGRYEVYNGQPEPIKKRLSLTEAKRFVGELLAGQQEPAPSWNYMRFLETLRAGGWTTAQITGEVEQPEELVALLTEVGLGQAEQWIMEALDKSDLTDDKPEQTVEEADDPATVVGQEVALHETPELTKVIERMSNTPEVKAIKVRAGNASDPAPRQERPKAKDVQALADELVWRCGKNTWNRGDLPELMKECGLRDEELNDRIRERALENFQARYRRNLNAEKLNWTGPVEQITASESEAHVWATECGMYRIMRVGGASPRYLVTAKIIAPAAKEREVANDLKTLREALERAEEYHQRQMDLPAVKSNKNRILDEAVLLGLHKRPAAQNYNPEETEESDMHVSEKKAGVLLTAMGMPDVENWSITKLTKAVNGIATVTAGGSIPEDKDLRTLYKTIRRANEAGTKITVGAVSAEPAVKPGKGKPAAEKTKPGKPGKASGASKTGRIKIMGKYSAGPFARWLGQRGVDYATALKIMEDNGGCSLSEASLKWELKETRDNKPPASVEKEDASSLRSKYNIKVK